MLSVSKMIASDRCAKSCSVGAKQGKTYFLNSQQKRRTTCPVGTHFVFLRFESTEWDLVVRVQDSTVAM